MLLAIKALVYPCDDYQANHLWSDIKLAHGLCTTWKLWTAPSIHLM